MLAVVPYVVAFFAPLQAASGTPVAPSDAMIQQAASFARRPLAPTPAMVAQAAPTATSSLAIPNAFAPEIVVPDESRVQLAPHSGNWWFGREVPTVPEAVVSATAHPTDNLFVTVRLMVRDRSMAPAAAASLLVESAVENGRVGHHNLAREDIALALERDPTNADALWMRAGHRYAAADYAGALRDADAVLATRPTDRAARYARAAVLTECGRAADAHRELTALIRECPGEARYYEARALAALALEQYQDADLDSEIAVELAPAEPGRRLSRMKVCLALGDYAGAFDQYQAGLRRSLPATAGAAAFRVQIELMEYAYLYSTRTSAAAGDAIAHLDWMVKMSPDYNPPRLMLATELLRVGRPDLAEQVAADAVALDPAAARAFHLRGQARAALARPDALADFETAYRLEAAADTRGELVARYAAAGRRAEARALAEAGLAAHPQCGQCRQFLADDGLRRGDFAAAERHATCALWLARDTAEAAAARLTRAVARLARGDAAAGDDFAALRSTGERGTIVLRVTSTLE